MGDRLTQTVLNARSSHAIKAGMESQPPSDAEIRSALKQKLLCEHGTEPDMVILEELGVYRGSVRADVALVNGVIHGYEIKSDRDSLRRLGAQVELYSKCFDHATLVVGTRYLKDALDILPRWWGVLRVTSPPPGLHFKSIRAARKNPDREARVLAELLWLDNAILLLERHGLARGVRGKPRRVVWDRICEHLSIDAISAAVRENLKARSRPLAAR